MEMNSEEEKPKRRQSVTPCENLCPTFPDPSEAAEACQRSPAWD